MAKKLIAFLVFTVAPALYSAPFTFSYGGQLTDSKGFITGPVTVELKFYRVITSGTSIPVSPVIFENTVLHDGVFQVDVTQLTPEELATVFDGSSDVYVEVIDKTNNVTYPRQKANAVPFALRTPVDGSTISYNSAGALQVTSIPQSTVTGLSSALSGKVDANAITAVSKGGTGLSSIPANGEILIGNGTGYTKSTITAGSGVTITNAAGSITVSSSGGSSGITALTGDATATGPGSAALTLAPSGVTAGTYSKVTVDGKGRVTSGGSLTASDIPSLDSSKITTGTLTNSVLPVIIPPGTILMFAGNTAPSGWLPCDGSLVSTTTYANLFSALSYTYGGSGAQFALPDFRGVFPRFNNAMFGGSAGAYDTGRAHGSLQTAGTARPTTSFTTGGGSISGTAAAQSWSGSVSGGQYNVGVTLSIGGGALLDASNSAATGAQVGAVDNTPRGPSIDPSVSGSNSSSSVTVAPRQRQLLVVVIPKLDLLTAQLTALLNTKELRYAYKT